MRAVNADPTEGVRTVIRALLSVAPSDRESLEADHGQVWTTDELCRDFEVQGFMAPYCVAKRKSDGKVGSLVFQGKPRFYHSFRID